MKFVVIKNREEKARKIESVLEDYLKSELKGMKILDIGSGNGEVIEYFGKKNYSYSVDVLDQRKNKNSKVKFKLINSGKLPFKDNFFDIIITNHVIEHVKNQELHLAEIKRVLKNGGICYLATPNRLFPWETHYKLIFIHYLPLSRYHKILKTLGKYEEDIYILTYPELKKLLRKYFEINEYTHKIIKYPEKFGFSVPIFRLLPLFLLKKINFMSQTNVFVLKKHEKS